MINEAEIREILKENKSAAMIATAIRHQNRIKFHVKTELNRNNDAALTDFFSFVQNLIPQDKFKIFKTLLRFPLPTNEITNECFSRLKRVFDGKNKSLNYTFADNEFDADWETYRRDTLKEPEVWETKGWSYFKTEPNSVLIVDMKRDGGNGRPAPYFYWLPIADVIAYQETAGNFDYIIFRQDGKRVAVIDDYSYRIFEFDGKNIGRMIGEEQPHGLGYTPARFFIQEGVSIEEEGVKISPITRVLGSLDWYLFFSTSKQHLDLYAAYPIYSGYAQSCDYHDNRLNVSCKNGLLVDAVGNYVYDPNGTISTCPACGTKKIAGAGSFVEIPAPDEREGVPDMRNPVQILSIDKNSLDYNVSEVERLKNNIIVSVIGSPDDMQAKEAINEQQVKANFESQTNIVFGIKKCFESAQYFVDSTICRLRYGEYFSGCSINYGTEFFVYDVQTLCDKYNAAKAAGASDSELDNMQVAIFESEYRNDPKKLQRMRMLFEIEPYRHLNRNDVILLFDKGIITDKELKSKLNFSFFIKRFERENGTITEYALDLPYKERITKIIKTINEYE